MYRSSAQMHMARGFLPSPAPDELSDLESEIVSELDKKRRILDREIANFKQQKDREFQQFETELRSKKRSSGSTTATPSRDMPDSAKLPADTSSSVLSFFVGGLGMRSPKAANGSVSKERQISDTFLSPKSKPTPFPSKPTLSVDRLNINGTTTPPFIGSPPETTASSTRSFSRSPSNISATPPRKSSVKPPPSFDRESPDFSGLFTPTYLPLLDSRQASTSLPHEQHLSPNSHVKRALTAPVLPSSSLPSALRTASGNVIKKRKHVTFQLADSAIVEPSSSYEEIPTPDPVPVEQNSIEELMGKAVSRQEKDKENKKEQPDPDLDSTPTPTPTSPVRLQPMAGPIDMDFSSAMASDDDDVASRADSGGFFSFDEELEDMNSAEVEYHEDADADADSRDENRNCPSSKHAGGEDGEEEGKMMIGSFSAGSVPIDIVRPSSFR